VSDSVAPWLPAWVSCQPCPSQNLTTEIASAAGTTLVDKHALFRQADIVTIHLILSRRTAGLIGAAELALMKPTARLIDTSRGPIVDQAALIEALQARRIAGAALDVFDVEPLPCWRRRTSATSRKSSIAPSTAMPPPASPRGSTPTPRKADDIPSLRHHRSRAVEDGSLDCNW